MLGDLKFCFMFVILCLSVYFRNVGCWHVPVLGPVAFAQGSKKKKKDHQISLDKPLKRNTPLAEPR